MLLAALVPLAIAVDASAQRLGKDLDEIVRLADREPKVRVVAGWQGPIVKEITDGYSKRYPKLGFQTSDTGALAGRERILNEALAGMVAHDLVNVSGELRASYVKAGVLVGPIPWSKLFPALDKFHFSPDGYFVASGFSRYGMIYNPKLVPAERVPKTWEDCLDPYWKGKMVVYTRPRTFTALYSTWGKEKSLAYATKLKNSGPVWVSDQTTGVTQVATGEYAMGCGFPYHTFLTVQRRDPKADVRFVVPTELPIHIGEAYGVMKGAKSPNAAVLLAAHLVTEEVQMAYELYGRSSPFKQGTGAWKLMQESGAKPMWGGWEFEGEKEGHAAAEIVQAWGFPRTKPRR
jgi:ABC-type Fe3+ transport system substrate-binding protein